MQKHVKKPIGVTKVAIELEVGELAEILGNNSLAGLVVTKIYGGMIVALTSNEAHTAFVTTWANAGGLTYYLRVLGPSESVVLDNNTAEVQS